MSADSLWHENRSGWAGLLRHGVELRTTAGAGGSGLGTGVRRRSELAAEISPVQAEAVLMRRIQDPNIREARRLTNLLLKLKRRGHKSEAPEASDMKVGHDVSENKGP